MNNQNDFILLLFSKFLRTMSNSSQKFKIIGPKAEKNLPAKFPTQISNFSQKKLKIPVFTL